MKNSGDLIASRMADPFDNPSIYRPIRAAYDGARLSIAETWRLLGHCIALAAERALRTHGVSSLLIFVFLLAGSPLRAEETPRRVLMLHAFNYTFPATTTVGEAARRRLLERSPQKIEIDAEFLDLARVTDLGHEQRTADFLREKYARSPPDLVITLGSAALPFIVKHRDTIAPKVPVVFTTISPQNYAALHPPADMTGVITEFDLNKTLALAERLQPNTRRLFVIAGSGATDQRWHAVARRIIESRERTFDTTYLFELPYERLVSTLSQVPRDAIVILLTVFADSNGKTFIPAELATKLAAHLARARLCALRHLHRQRHCRRLRRNIRVGRHRRGGLGSGDLRGQGPVQDFRREPILGKPIGSISGRCSVGICARATFPPTPPCCSRTRASGSGIATLCLRCSPSSPCRPRLSLPC